MPTYPSSAHKNVLCRKYHGLYTGTFHDTLGIIKTSFRHSYIQEIDIMLTHNHLNIPLSDEITNDSQVQRRRQTVLITGSGRGIGKATALYFASHHPEQWNIVINNGHNQTELNHTKEEILRIPDTRCLAISADVGDYEACCQMFREISKNFGPVDILINNAGISYIGLFTDMTPDQWQQILHTNLNSVINCCHLAIPHMVHQQQGKIINVSSVWGITGASCEVIYSASKGGINGFTKALAKELGPSHIQVNAVACGVIDTEMNRGFSPEDREALIEEIPACRMGRPDEVAAFIYCLACGHEYLTGQVITLDGAWI